MNVDGEWFVGQGDYELRCGEGGGAAGAGQLELLFAELWLVGDRKTRMLIKRTTLADLDAQNVCRDHVDAKFLASARTK